MASNSPLEAAVIAALEGIQGTFKPDPNEVFYADTAKALAADRAKREAHNKPSGGAS